MIWYIFSPPLHIAFQCMPYIIAVDTVLLSSHQNRTYLILVLSYLSDVDWLVIGSFDLCESIQGYNFNPFIFG